MHTTYVRITLAQILFGLFLINSSHFFPQDQLIVDLVKICIINLINY